MKILVTNDDGIEAESLWALVAQLRKVAQVIVIAPDAERSAIGTAVSLFRPLHIQEFSAPYRDVTAYSTDGTPSDCVILGHGKLVPDVNIVISGINPGPNYGEDVFISGTVGAAMQGYTRGLPAVSISSSAFQISRASLDAGARVAAELTRRMAIEGLPRIFLNMNIPDLPLEKIGGIQLTHLARSSHINTVEEKSAGSRRQYHLVREKLPDAGSDGTDIQAIMQGNVSITPLYTSLFDKPPQHLLKKLITSLLNDAKKL
jgi:5'-nucleotidase